ncbi:MAG: alpha/beta fold hydrolase [Cyanobacteria bacterium J06642_2]
MAVCERTLELEDSMEWFYREASPSGAEEREPVLLLHGIPSQSYSWQRVMPALAEQGHLTIAPDWIGAGFSSYPDTSEFSYTPAAFVDALSAFVNTWAWPQFSLVVQGFGGSAGLLYALRHPDRIARLIVLNTPLSTSVKLPWKLKQLSLPLIGDMLTQDPLLVDRSLEGGGFYVVKDEDLNVYRKPFLTTSAAGRALLATLRNLQLPAVTAEIAAGLINWQQPTFILWGANDPWLPVAMAETTVQQMSKAELKVLDNVGHYPQQDWPEKVIEHVTPFLRRQVF